MSLTEKALAERMWGSFPALRAILEFKTVPDHYYGSSTVSDNVFDQLGRLLKLSILIRENKAQIIEALESNEWHGQLHYELHRVRAAYRWGAEIFHEAVKELDKKIGEEKRGDKTKSPLRELALRLAWYSDKYGGIPTPEIVRLFRIANGFDSSEKAKELQNLVVEILEYFDPPDV
jgi:hypothetical protein